MTDNSLSLLFGTLTYSRATMNMEEEG